MDIDSTEILVYGHQGQNAYNGHFESTCNHPLLPLNDQGDCLAAQLRPGNLHSADGWEDLLLPGIERQQAQGKEWYSAAMRPSPAGSYEAHEARQESGVTVGSNGTAYNLSGAPHASHSPIEFLCLPSWPWPIWHCSFRMRQMQGSRM